MMVQDMIETGEKKLSECQTTDSNKATALRDSDVDLTETQTIILHNVAVISLKVDEEERLCLAQISNTLLKDYSYNEIHNRRVALGITCVQCTPLQLEALRRAGAMPVSSRRCGMITRREAERLVKSFLKEITPPILPDDFVFHVYHECGWGCLGLFMPSRYNSSRAKCIRCCHCNAVFSPNKFIFHCHKLQGSAYTHPDAANFNSWRRHLKLSSQGKTKDVEYAWEDVKALFNGGSRKRVCSNQDDMSSDVEPSRKVYKSENSPTSSTSPVNLSPFINRHNQNTPMRLWPNTDLLHSRLFMPPSHWAKEISSMYNAGLSQFRPFPVLPSVEGGVFPSDVSRSVQPLRRPWMDEQALPRQTILPNFNGIPQQDMFDIPESLALGRASLDLMRLTALSSDDKQSITQEAQRRLQNVLRRLEPTRSV